MWDPCSIYVYALVASWLTRKLLKACSDDALAWPRTRLILLILPTAFDLSDPVVTGGATSTSFCAPQAIDRRSLLVIPRSAQQNDPVPLQLICYSICHPRPHLLNGFRL